MKRLEVAVRPFVSYRSCRIRRGSTTDEPIASSRGAEGPNPHPKDGAEVGARDPGVDAVAHPLGDEPRPACAVPPVPRDRRERVGARGEIDPSPPIRRTIDG